MKDYYQDVALVRVSNIIFSENVGPACLPFKYSARRQTFAGEQVSILGMRSLFHKHWKPALMLFRLGSKGIPGTQF